MKQDISSFISGDRLCVIVKPNAKQSDVLFWDQSRKALRVAVAAVPDKDRANAELLKLLKRLTGKKCALVSGAKSREKIIQFLN